jgi:hypothetical protein
METGFALDTAPGIGVGAAKDLSIQQLSEYRSFHCADRLHLS